MTPERWLQVEEIFQAALDLKPGEREQYVSQVCAGNLAFVERSRQRDDLRRLSHAPSLPPDQVITLESGVRTSVR